MDRTAVSRRTVTGMTLVAVLVLIASSCVVQGTWAAQTLPPPSDPWIGESLVDIACPTSTSCVAVGHRTRRIESSGRIVRFPLVARWQDGAWTDVAAANGPGDRTYRSVSCSSDSLCVLSWTAIDLTTGRTQVGADRWVDGRVAPLLLGNQHWDDPIVTACVPGGSCVLLRPGYRWTIDEEVTTVEEPLTVTPVALDCPSASFCLVATAADGLWTLGPRGFDPVDGAVDDEPPAQWSDIACLETDWCELTGRQPTADGPIRPVAGRWDATAVTVEALPTDDEAALVLSCAAPIACVAVSASGTPAAFAYNGIDWYPVSAPPAPPAGDRNIACAIGASTCTVVTAADVRAAATFSWPAPSP